MEGFRTEAWAWAKAHRRQLILTGISIVSLAAFILGIRNKESLFALLTSLKERLRVSSGSVPVKCQALSAPVSVKEVLETTRSYTQPTVPFDVSQHIRTLSGSRQHSVEKAMEAASMGIMLRPNQTLVDAYTKCAGNVA